MKRPAILLALLLAAISVDAQWIPIGPPGGAVNVIRLAGERVYAAGDAALFASDDKGASWTRLLLVPEMELTLLQVDPRQPSTLYVVAAQHASYFGLLFSHTRLFKSTDAGLSWHELMAGLPAEQSIASLTLDPANPSTLLAGLQCGVQYFSRYTPACDRCAQVTAGAGVYKSIDAGESWFASTSGLGGEDLCVRGVTTDGSTPNVVYAYSETLISTWLSRNSRSNDGGVTWTGAAPTSPSRDLLVHSSGRRFAVANPTDCRGCTPSSAIVVSDDGTSWRSITANLIGSVRSITSFAVDPLSDRTVYAATGGGLFLTRDLGASWSAIAPASDFRAARTIAIDERDARILYLGTSSGLFLSRDGGATWTEATLPQSGATVSGLAVAPDGTLFGVLQDFDVPRTVVRSRDGGRSWETLGRIGSLTNEAWWAGERPTMTVARDGILYVLSGDSPRIVKRHDGREWSDLRLPQDVYPSSIAADPHDAATLYVAAYPGKLLKTTDRGATWAVVVDRGGGSAWSVVLAPTSPTTVYFAVEGSLLRSSDAGGTWTDLSVGGQVTGIAIPPAQPETVYAVVCCHAGVLRSDNRGSTWTQLRSSDDARGVAIDPRNADVVYLRYVGGPGILRSTDRGASWSRYSGGLMSSVVNDLIPDPFSRRMYAATFRAGIFALSDPQRRRATRQR